MSALNKNHHPGDGSTGPRTPLGKEISSRNAIVHGGRSEKHVILPGESEDEYATLREDWFAQLTPHTYLEADIVDHLVQRHWAFKRCQRRVDETEARLIEKNLDFFTWTEADHRILQLALRYRSAAERAYKAARVEVESFRKNRIAEAAAIEGFKRARYRNVKIGISGEELDKRRADSNPPLTPDDMPPGGWFFPDPDDEQAEEDDPGREPPARPSQPDVPA